MSTDAELLHRYAAGREEAAFRQLVERHLNLVHSTALRLVNADAHLAQDVAQSVFTDLSRKAAQVGFYLKVNGQALSGWLHTSTRFAAAKAVRAEQCRRAREQEAHDMQQILHGDCAEPQLEWAQLRPVLDDAMGELTPADRDAVVLRFFEGKELRDIGQQLGWSEEAARKRVARALGKLRDILRRRGLKTSTAALSVVISAGAVSAAPAGLASAITSAALAASAVTGAGIVLTLLQFVAMTKTRISAVAVAFAVGVATPLLLSRSTPSSPAVVTQAVTNVVLRTNFPAVAGGNAPGATAKFHWSQLESPDYRQYVANLKAIGCPWETLKDIIIADLNTLYSPRLAKLRLPMDQEKWWLTDSRTRGIGWQRQAEANHLEAEKRGILRQLLGLDAVEALDAVWGVDEQSQLDLACIPPEKRGDVAELNVLYSQKLAAVRERALGMYDREVDMEIKQLRDERRAAMASLLTAEELFEFDLRFSEMARRLRDYSPAFDYTETEFRAAFAARDKFESQFGEGGRVYDRGSSEDRDRRRAARDETDATIRQALGEGRFKEWRRSQDNYFQDVHSFAAAWKMPESVPFQIYDLKEQSQAAADAIRNDTKLSSEEQRAKRREIRAQVEQSIRQLMGDKLGAQYIERGGGGGSWVNSIASKPN